MDNRDYPLILEIYWCAMQLRPWPIDWHRVARGTKPAIDLFFCTMGGVPMEFMGAYAPEANSPTSEATNS